MASFKKMAPLVALGATAALGAGGFFFYRHLEHGDEDARKQRFADLSACLLGRSVTSDAEALEDFASLEAWTFERPPEMRGKADGGAWPDRCGEKAQAFSNSVRDSAFIDKETKVAMLDAISVLATDLSTQATKRTPCAGDVASLWRKALDLKVEMAATSTVKGPSRPSVMDGSADLPFASVLPIEGGTEWIFLAEKKGKDAPIGVCTVTTDGLACKNLTGDAHVSAGGMWASTSFVPLVHRDKLQLLHDGAITDVQRGVVNDAYADTDGTVYAVVLDRSGNRKLLVKAFDQKASMASLDEAILALPSLELPSDAASSARFVGTNLVVRARDHLYRVPVTPQAKLGEPVALDAPVDEMGNVCRSGDSFVVSFPAPGQRHALFVTSTYEAKLMTFEGVARCGASGEFWNTKEQECRPGGCHDPIPASVRGLLPDTAAVGLAGDKVVTAWLVPAGRGMLARVATDGGTDDLPDVVIAKKTDVEEHRRVAIFGGPKGALVMAETKSGLIGAHVGADGKVAPLAVDWK